MGLGHRRSPSALGTLATLGLSFGLLRLHMRRQPVLLFAFGYC